MVLYRKGEKFSPNPEFQKNILHRVVFNILYSILNEIDQQVAEEILTSFGVEVEIASNGREALEKVKASGVPSRYHVVLMDLHMPEMDGFESTREIRKLEEYCSLPIIAMTADALVGTRAICLEAGMMDMVTKPVDAEDGGEGGHQDGPKPNGRGQKNSFINGFSLFLHPEIFQARKVFQSL